jgi:exoribonuclease R
MLPIWIMLILAILAPSSKLFSLYCNFSGFCVLMHKNEILVYCRYCGSLEPMPMPAGSGGVAHALFVSKDRRIPKIRIQTRQLGNLLNKRIIVAVDSWDVMSRYPSGHYVRTIGDIGDKETETEASLYT